MIISFFALIFTTIVTSDGLPIAKTEQGTYVGLQEKVNNININYWYGIPYAQQPINQLRWKPPLPLTKSNSVYKADSPNACPQEDTHGIPMSESCLTLNVYAPDSATNLPVYVWIYGGSFTTGAGAFYDSGPFVSTSVNNSIPVVVVTINYRIGLLGFMADQGLFDERTGFNNSQTTGNYGVLDQMMALQWVKSNIQSFGGDPNQITIGGESAGGISVTILMTSPLVEKNSFQRAIIESGNIWPDAVVPLSQAINTTGQFVRETTGCTTLECLRDLTVEQLLSIQHVIAKKSIFGSVATPVIDGYVVNDTMENYFAKGTFQRVPILVGSTTNETSLFTCPLFNGTASSTQVEQFFNLAYNKTIVNAIPNVYGSITKDTNPLTYLNTVYSDSWAHCGARRLSAQFANNGIASFLYTYNHIITIAPDCLGVGHATELPFLFPSMTSHFFPNYNLTDAERELSTKMMLYWANFVSKSDPNYVGSNVRWNPYMTSSDADFVIDIYPRMRNNYYYSICSRFWDNFAFEPTEF